MDRKKEKQRQVFVANQNIKRSGFYNRLRPFFKKKGTFSLKRYSQQKKIMGATRRLSFREKEDFYFVLIYIN